MGSVFLRNDIGIPSESFFAKMKRFFIKLASAKLQHEKADSKFFANLWRFEMLKSAHSSSVYGGNFFFVSQKCTNLEMSFDAKMTPLANLTIEARNRPICTLLVTVKK